MTKIDKIVNSLSIRNDCSNHPTEHLKQCQGCIRIVVEDVDNITQTLINYRAETLKELEEKVEGAEFPKEEPEEEMENNDWYWELTGWEWAKDTILEIIKEMKGGK